MTFKPLLTSALLVVTLLLGVSPVLGIITTSQINETLPYSLLIDGAEREFLLTFPQSVTIFNSNLTITPLLGGISAIGNLSNWSFTEDNATYTTGTFTDHEYFFDNDTTTSSRWQTTTIGDFHWRFNASIRQGSTEVYISYWFNMAYTTTYVYCIDADDGVTEHLLATHSNGVTNNTATVSTDCYNDTDTYVQYHIFHDPTGSNADSFWKNINSTSIGENFSLTSYPQDVSVSLNGTSIYFLGGNMTDTTTISLTPNSTFQSILNGSPTINLTINSSNLGNMTIDSYFSDYSDWANFTFSNATDIEVVQSNGSYLIINQTSINLSLHDLISYETITLNFMNKSFNEPEKQGWYQSYQFYNDLITPINATLYPLIPDQEVSAYMHSGSNRLPGYIELRKTHNGIWKTVQRLQTNDDNNEISAYVASDNTYFFLGESDNYDDGSLIDIVSQGVTTPFKIPMTLSSSDDPFRVHSNCGLFIYDLNTTCYLYIFVDKLTNITVYSSYTDGAGTWSNSSAFTVTSSFATQQLYVNSTFSQVTINITIDDIGADTYRFRLVNRSTTEGHGTQYVEEYNYTMNITGITIPSQIQSGYPLLTFFLLSLMAIFMGVFVNTYRKGWGPYTFFIAIGIISYQYAPVLLAAVLVLFGLWIWRFKFKRIAVEEL